MKGLDEFIFREFVRLAFDHDDVGLVADVDEVEIAVSALVVGRVDDELSVHAADAHRTDRAGEGDVGKAEGGGRAVHREDVGVVHAIGAEQDGDDLGFVEVTFWEQRAQWAVRHAAGEDFLFGWAAFALEVAAWEDAGSGGFFLIFHGKWEPGLAGLHFRGGNGGDEDDGVAAADGDGAIGEFGNFAGFKRHRIRSDVGRDSVDIHSQYLFSFFSAYSPSSGMRNGHSSFLDKNPQHAYWRAAEDFLSGDSGGILVPGPFRETATGFVQWLSCGEWFSGGVRDQR